MKTFPIAYKIMVVIISHVDVTHMLTVHRIYPVAYCIQTFSVMSVC
jgi:hypothetical protein